MVTIEPRKFAGATSEMYKIAAETYKPFATPRNVLPMYTTPWELVVIWTVIAMTLNAYPTQKICTTREPSRQGRLNEAAARETDSE